MDDSALKLIAEYIWMCKTEKQRENIHSAIQIDPGALTNYLNENYIILVQYAARVTGKSVRVNKQEDISKIIRYLSTCTIKDGAARVEVKPP